MIIDFDDLKINGGCTINDTALRAISLNQLEMIQTHAARRLEQAPWKVTKYIQGAWTDDYMLSKLEEVTLYDLNQQVVLLSTVERQCSMVELLAIQSQQPDFFVSHWQVLPTALLEVTEGDGGRWGEPVALMSLCLKAHTRDYCLETPEGWCKGEKWGSDYEGDGGYGIMFHKEPHPGYLGGRSPLYWVCAHANNRELPTSSNALLLIMLMLFTEHKLGDEITGGSLSDSSFARAMKLSRGTVSVLDAEGRSWGRIWCGKSAASTVP